MPGPNTTITFNSPCTSGQTITLSWTGVSGTIVSAFETAAPVRTTNFQFAIGTNAVTQASNFATALGIDYGGNFNIAYTSGTDFVVINSKNTNNPITGYTSGNNITFDPPFSTSGATTGVTEVFEFTSTPQEFVPAHNPITFTFYSDKYDYDGYRYYLNLYESDTNFTNKLASLKVIPTQTGLGYVDIQKIIASYVKVDFNQSLLFNNDAENSIITFDVGLGEEYTAYWNYNRISSSTVTGFTGYFQLSATTSGNTHLYQVGDIINVATISTGTTASLNGLQTVVAVPNTSSVIVNSIYPTGSTTPLSISGITSFNDNRKTRIEDILVYSATTAFNGALAWDDYKYWLGTEYTLESASSATTQNKFLCTSLPSVTELRTIEDNVYLAQTQDLWLNYYVDNKNSIFYLDWELYNQSNSLVNSDVVALSAATTNGAMKQFKIGFQTLSITPSNGDYLVFKLTDGASKTYTRDYRVYFDSRCKIENYEILFMDRYGSLLSIPFYLRDKETIKIKKEEYKQAQFYFQNITYDVSTQGSKVYNVEVDRDYQLNTDWLNDGMLRLYEQMLTSPNTWVKLTTYDKVNDRFRTNYYSCLVNETADEIVKQKNKRLIRKTVNITLGVQNPINI